ncbi:dynein heavy chain [Massospora cicadina]|nr:dynein heavy chain [Massospora cicadina]
MEGDNIASASPPIEAGDPREPNPTIISSSGGGGTIDPKRVVDFVAQLLPLTLGASAEDIGTSLLLFSETIEICGKFAADPQIPVLYAQKEKASLEASDDSTEFVYSVKAEISYQPTVVGSLALIKRNLTLDSSRPLQGQIQLINLPGPASDSASPYEALHAVIHHAVTPYFNAFTSSKGPSPGEGFSNKRDDSSLNLGIPAAKKKFAELELSLLHLQQNVEIPEIFLLIHPAVQKAVDACRADAKRPTVDAIDSNLLQDSSFLNRLQGDVNRWIKEIQKVTKLNRDPSTGSALQEINFWLSMERALEKIDHQLRSDEIVLSLDILKHAKRFHATVSFHADTGHQEASERVSKYNQVMKDFPISDLLAATDVDRLTDALVQVHAHLHKKLKNSPYPVRRSIQFVEAISRDMTDQLLKILGTRRLMYIDYADFDHIMRSVTRLFSTWEDLAREFTTLARDLTRKRGEKFFYLKLESAHAKLQERVDFIQLFRKQHEQLQTTIVKVMARPSVSRKPAGDEVTVSDLNAVEEVKHAYENVKHIDVLDISAEGTEAWVAAEAAYNERVSRVETQIIIKLRDRLGAAKTADEMFRVFSKFNALFVRPKIRGAIQEYQTQLIESVKKDIQGLYDKFKVQYRNSQAHQMSQLRDIPPVSGTIIWVKQIERQLSMYMKRVEDVLGKGWEMYADGHKLEAESNSFRKKLDTRHIFNLWAEEIGTRDHKIAGNIFSVTRHRAQNNQYRLGINFDSQTITLFKEVRNLLWLGFQVPHTIRNLAKDVKRLYPYAVSLIETVRTYTQVVDQVQAHPEVAMLVAGYHKEAQELITRGIALRWDYLVSQYDTRVTFAGGELALSESRHLDFIHDFATLVATFQSKMDAVLRVNHEIQTVLKALQTCAFERDALAHNLLLIQKHIDQLNFESYSNLDQWVAYLDSQVQGVLRLRLQRALKAWVGAFSHAAEEKPAASETKIKKVRRRVSERHVQFDEQQEEGLYRPTLQVLVHEILLRNQVMYLDPPIEQARASWYHQLHEWLSTVCALPKLQNSRYELGLESQAEDPRESTYMSILTTLDDDSLFDAYARIEAKIKEVTDYVNIWLQYQSLWDLEPELIYSQLGEDLHRWQQILTEIKRARSTFDNSESEKRFGPIVVDYENVQSKVNSKYDAWQKEILREFGAKLGNAMREFNVAVSKSRVELEHFSLETNSTTETVTFITFVQDLKLRVERWTRDVDLFRHGQKTLERQRYQFAADWVYVDQVEGEWSAFNEILSHKNNSIQEQLAGLQMKIDEQDRTVEGKITELLAAWVKDKPIQGNLKPDIAINTLNIFEGRLNRLKHDYDQVCDAKAALSLDGTRDDRLDPALEELRDLKSVWQALAGIWTSINELRETPWASVVPHKVRQQLNLFIQDTQAFSARMRQYSAYDYVRQTLHGYLDVNPLLGELKSEALRDRHWRQLFKRLRCEGRFLLSEMALGHIWDLDLRANEAPVREVITTAQGEMALEEFLRQVRETWSNFTLELVNYQNKCRLIKGWDDMMTKCSENLNSLSAMKMSPYHKVFEEEASAWEDKLNRIHVLFFDVWIDVQRQWVYLEGIFSGSADIKHLLPVETTRFQNINTEFLTVMKRVYKSPFVLDVLNLPGIQKSLERLKDLLGKIQKALGEYLEKERSSFPRFYFVGDEDLLEIIGNSKDVLRIQKHFKKMFAGIANILLNDDKTVITGMAPKDGEEVTFKHPISLKETPRINDWLTMLEKEMKVTLAILLSEAIEQLQSIYLGPHLDHAAFLAWIQGFPAQLVVLAAQAVWTQTVEASLAQAGAGHLDQPTFLVERGLTLLADAVLTDLEITQRRKCEHLITELVHQRDVIRQLAKHQVRSADDFKWLYQMRFYFNPAASNPLECLTIKMANATFAYGYEYLGVPDRLVQTPLTDRCYLTLTQALESRLGGSPFGPAGTGKTESVKALGVQLGRFVLVFCCDENFDFQAMGRIFVGLCQVGAWGCFDEFNRLEEKILSAVSQQIQTIQLGLKQLQANPNQTVELVGKSVKIHRDTGIFITMNPGYAGRSNLPDNLKKLFRSMAMTKPDRELIAQVMLYSQGFRSAETLASKVVPLFVLCNEQLSPQSHYDFGLRALKSVLVSAGNLKRARLQKARETMVEGGCDDLASEGLPEQEILMQSIRETLMPKLVSDDIPLLRSLMSDVFPGVEYAPVDLGQLKEAILNVCQERNLVGEPIWMEKIIQLYQIQNLHHGLMMVGPSGSGKSVAWRTLLAALERVDGVEGVSYVIDPKALSKEALYGSLDPTTREWTDGLFTHILRRILDNVRGESGRRHWIIFDGDVDPEWVENLNSVLDDNRLLTLPNGERLGLPPNVRVMFEVENLRQATLATVSRCGMVWYSDDVVSLSMLYTRYLTQLKTQLLSEPEEEASQVKGPDGESVALATQEQCAALFAPYFVADGLVTKALEYAATLEHIMDFTPMRVLTTLFSLLNKVVRNVVEFNTSNVECRMAPDALEDYLQRKLVLSLVWSFSGDAKLNLRHELGEFIRSITTIDLPPAAPGSAIIDYDVSITDGAWVAWQSLVPTIEIETHTVAEADVVIPTVDTVRHEEVLYSWLSEHRPLMLCGPPGSGKTMTLFSALRKLPDMEVVGLNFSSATTPELIMKTFEQYCEYRKTPNGVILAPTMIGRWLVIFCDEINLPATDRYGTQRVISFLRQLIEHGGYWRAKDKCWVALERIQFVGACNPPTDPGRVPLTHRFLRHAPLVMVDYPGEVSLNQIYSTFARAMLKVIPELRGYSDALTAAMIDLYLASQRRFTPDIQAHYIYSPRELTRWMRGIYEAIKPLDTLSVEGLVRIWAHEALRLFQDRLVNGEERRWTDDAIDEIAQRHFPTIDWASTLERPILFSNWLSKHYVPISREELRDYTKARLKVFYEEELDVPLVLHNAVLDHVLRIDRVFRQMQGHLLLIGVSGSGKTTLSRFVAWMNGLSIFQIKAHNRYTGEDFDEDLRAVLRRAGCKGEKICFIMDESNVLGSGFLERMNTLLANAEVPGLFEGDEYSALMNQCKEAAQREGLMLDSGEELYRWFTQQVMRNLHVVFTMNPPEGGLGSRAATSPALFNRCVLDWFGDWSDQAFFQVGKEFTNALDLDLPAYAPPTEMQVVYRDLPMPPTHRDALINAFVFVHMTLYDVNAKLSKRQGRHNHVTPRHYLDFINHYVRLHNEKREDLEEQQRHLNVGLDKLHDTVVQVEALRASLALKGRELDEKNREANAKLKEMVADQQEAESKREDSIKVQGELEIKNRAIAERTAIVMADLADAEPAVQEAQKSVRNIKKNHLTEVRSMANPPLPVKIAMESVCTLLGHRIESWKTVQGILRRDDFISSIEAYRAEEKLTRAIRERIRKEYMTKPEYNFETVNRASKACGPLVQWVIAQVNYSAILDKVGPLRQEVVDLEASAQETQKQASSIEGMIQDLEASIVRYKEEYAHLISQVQAIKGEMERVQSKVSRSVTLLGSLASERERWEASSQAFETQMGTIVGDCVLSAAYLAYGGYFDQQYREQLFNKWASHLMRSGIQFKQDISLTEYLSSADERAAWQANALPADDLCIENAIMLRRFNRYPLIIDPSGQATAFLANEYRSRKITVTSFLDDSFLKNLESALRFGNPLLIQDVENLDPILNPVLNRELRRTGGRVLIRVGGQDIDFSPSFMLFLSTRDPSVNFPPDVCSRVTFVNFTVTRGSLMSQCLNRVLKAESPETDRKRADLVKLQGEFRLRLRHLEKSLLQALSESKGNLLDDDTVIDTLETLKREAGEVARKVQATDAVISEVEAVLQGFTPLAQACSSIFFVLDQLHTLHHFYHFSLGYFFDIFNATLSDNPNLRGVTGQAERLAILSRDLFTEAYRRTSLTLRHDDHVTFATLLAHIALRSTPGAIPEDDYAFFIGSHEAIPEAGGPISPFPTGLFTEEAAAALNRLSDLNGFDALPAHVSSNLETWSRFVAEFTGLASVPQAWAAPDHEAEHHALFRKLLIVKCVHPDQLIAASLAFVEAVFGPRFLSQSNLDFRTLTLEEVRPSTPVALCSVPGYDASHRVDNLASELSVRCASVAMGSAEGFALAEHAITTAAKGGTWVLLKNVHLAPAWLGQLEKRLHALQPHKAFRLFLTMETHPKVPVNLLRLSRVLLFEPPPGIKANLHDSLRSAPPARYAQGPAERARLHFLLAWLHAVVQERLRYVPLGWSKAYEFNDADLACGIATLDSWLDGAAGSRSNLAPEKIPWGAIRTLLAQSVYGGKIDNEFDQRLLESFIATLFVPQSYELDFALVRASEDSPQPLLIPDAISADQFARWCAALPDLEPPSWLGLPSNAQKVLQTQKGHAFLTRVRRMQSLADDEVPEPSPTQPLAAPSNLAPAWMRALSALAESWLKLLPESLTPLPRAPGSSTDPLTRVFGRECAIGAKLLSVVRADLRDISAACRGELKQSNHLRRLMDSLNRGLIPGHWRQYKVPAATSAAGWVVDFRRRLAQLEGIAHGGPSCDYGRLPVWLGGLFIPEAYITATRQVVAQRHRWSLEDLALQVNLGATATHEDHFTLQDLKLEGAEVLEGRLQLTSAAAHTRLASTTLRWINRRSSNPGLSPTAQLIALPTYLNSDRSELLFVVTAPSASPHHLFSQRGVAIALLPIGAEFARHQTSDAVGAERYPRRPSVDNLPLGSLQKPEGRSISHSSHRETLELQRKRKVHPQPTGGNGQPKKLQLYPTDPPPPSMG